MDKDQTEEVITATTITANPFYSQTSTFSDTEGLSHQPLNTVTIDPISDINQIDLADGLKDSLIKHGIDLEALLNTASERTAEILGIESYIAKLIHNAAMRHYRLDS